LAKATSGSSAPATFFSERVELMHDSTPLASLLIPALPAEGAVASSARSSAGMKSRASPSSVSGPMNLCTITPSLTMKVSGTP
jgi:hypothetical protein